jgi:hypothetical protein
MHPNLNGNANFFNPNQMPIFGQPQEFFGPTNMSGFSFGPSQPNVQMSPTMAPHRMNSHNYHSNARHVNKPFNRMPFHMNKSQHYKQNFNLHSNGNGSLPFLCPTNSVDPSIIQKSALRPQPTGNIPSSPVRFSSELSSPSRYNQAEAILGNRNKFSSKEGEAPYAHANRQQKTWNDRSSTSGHRSALIQLTVPSESNADCIVPSNTTKLSEPDNNHQLHSTPETRRSTTELSSRDVPSKFPRIASDTNVKKSLNSSPNTSSQSAGQLNKSQSTLGIDEEYQKKLEEQKRKREEFLRLKEERRKQKSVQMASQQPLTKPTDAEPNHSNNIIQSNQNQRHSSLNHQNNFNYQSNNNNHFNRPNATFNNQNNNFKSYHNRDNLNPNVGAPNSSNNQFRNQTNSNHVRPPFKRRFPPQS